MTRGFVVLALVAQAAACSERDTPQLRREPPRPRRVIEPPSRGVRALPPHAIRADGVGPYKLGALAADLLDQLPSGPRITQFTIPGMVQRDMLRGEDDAILIGTEPQGRATFVAVVRGEIARTEAGIQVGSSRDQLEAALGPGLVEPERARDPRVVVPTRLDNAHVVVDGNRIAAIVLVPAVERPKDTASDGKDAKEHPCTRPPDDLTKRVFGACLTQAGELLRTSDDEIALLARDGEKVVTSVRVPGLMFATALKNPADGRDDVIAITDSRGDQARTWSLIAYRIADGKLLRIIEPTPLYQLTAAHARWVGAELRDLDLLVELTAKAETIEVGGLLAVRGGTSIRDIVVISPVTVARRRGKSVPAEPVGSGSDAGSSDAPGAGHSQRPAR
jgi:hypothetical protein